MTEPVDPREERGPERPADPEGGVHEPVEDTTPGAPDREPEDHTPPLPREERAGNAPELDAGDRAALAMEPPERGASTGGTVLTALLPGAGHLLVGAAIRGAGYLVVWGTLLAALWLGWDRIMSIPETGSLDDWVALATLAAAMVLVWLMAMRDFRGASAADARQEAALHAQGVYGDEGGGRRAAGGAPGEEEGGASQWSIAARHFRRNTLASVGLVLVVLLYLVAFLAPLLAPYDPIAQGDLTTMGYLAPGGDHLLGTDQFGRDVLSRMIYGARISLAIGFIAVALAIVLGSLLGAVAGYLGGKVDAVIMRFTDMVMAFPRLVLLILIIALFEPSLTLIILVLGLTQWPGTARLVRGEVLSLREQEYIQAARALGFGRSRIILRHLIPNVLAPVIVAATLGIGNTIVLEAGLSFLGMGVQPPTPSWGTLVADGRQNLIGAWWVATFPGLAIVVTVLAFNLVGDGLRDALDPRLRS
ncbi:MAG TPA: oligopeptide ABC transporter permease [Longimicrobiales bacterium]|nr:oligopeptide ABC transporter permease [Longimicrobiales bacterium]